METQTESNEQQPPADAGPPEQRTFKRALECPLSEEQLIKRAEEMAQTELELEELDTQTAALNVRKKAKRGRRLELAHEIESGTEEREVVCREVRLFAENVIRTYRTDTEELLEERPMNGADRQESMAFDGPANGHEAETKDAGDEGDDDATLSDEDFEKAFDDDEDDAQ